MSKNDSKKFEISKTRNFAASKVVAWFAHYLWDIIHQFQLKMFEMQEQEW